MKFKIRAVIGFAAVGITVILAACNKYDDTGSNVLPNTDNVNLIYTDSTTITAITVKEDSLRTIGFTGFPVSSNSIGSYTDPVFGRTDASVYAQMNLSKFNFSYGATATPDSLILCLALSSHYGDTTSALHFKIYRLDSLINKDSAYYSNSTIQASTLIGDAILTINPADSVYEGGVKKAPHIRIPLNMALAQELMTASNTASIYADNTAFADFFKGIYISVEPENTVDKGCLYQFNYKAAQSKLSLYYKYSVDSDSLSFNYLFDDLLRFNNFNHNYTSSEVGAALIDNTTGANFTYVQSMAGVKTKIVLPNIKSYFNNPSVVINNAVLVFKAEDNSTYAPHTNMTLAYVDSTGKALSFTPDNNETANQSDGTYNKATGEYRFNVTRYINKVITDRYADYGLYLRGSAAIINANRTKIYGTANGAGRIKLELTYSKF